MLAIVLCYSNKPELETGFWSKTFDMFPFKKWWPLSRHFAGLETKYSAYGFFKHTLYSIKQNFFLIVHHILHVSPDGHNIENSGKQIKHYFIRGNNMGNGLKGHFRKKRITHIFFFSVTIFIIKRKVQ